MKINLSGGSAVIVDPEDAHIVLYRKWRLNNSGYACVGCRYGGKFKTVFLHRVITGASESEKVDHKNRIRVDCRKENLRKCSILENARNGTLRDTNNSGYKGVSWNTSKRKFVAQISVNWKKIHLGYFDSPIDAAGVYDVAARKHHGEFAATNEDLRAHYV